MATREETLIEKIVRAKVELEGARRPHTNGCASEDLTGHPVACNCGADAANAKIARALKELKL